MKAKGATMNGNDAVVALEQITSQLPPLAQPVRASLEFSAEQQRMIRNTFANGASETEFAVLMEVSKARGLNPVLGQIHFVQRWTKDRGNVWSYQVSIDGFRAIAERTGKYDGQDEPEFVYADDGKSLVLARVRVYRKDQSRPSVGVAYFAEYAQFTKDGALTKMWREKPHIMIAKCAESIAIRKAFPQDTSGLYTPEEMGHDEAPSRKVITAPIDAVEETDGDKIDRWTDAITACKTQAALLGVGKEIKKELMSEHVRLTLSVAYGERQKELKSAARNEAPASDDGPIDIDRIPGGDDQ